MGWIQEQVRQRREQGERELQGAYERLALSVMDANEAQSVDIDLAKSADIAVGAILAHFDIPQTKIPDELEDPSDRIDYALRPRGIMKRSVTLRGEWWKDSIGAYVGKLKAGGMVAILPSGVSGYSYIDPTSKKRVRVGKKTAPLLEEEALAVYRPLPQRRLTLVDVLWFMARCLSPNDYFLIIGTSLVVTLLGSLPTVAYKIVFNNVIPAKDPSLVGPIAALLLGIIVAQSIIDMTSKIVTRRLTTKLEMQMGAAMYARLLLLKASFFKRFAPGELTNRTAGIIEFVRTFSKSILTTGLSALFSLFYIGQILMLVPQLALPALITVALQVLAFVIALKHTVRHNDAQFAAKTAYSGVVPSLLRGIQKIKLAGAERLAFSYWAKSYADVAVTTYKRPSLLLASPKLIPLITAAGSAICLFVAAKNGVGSSDFLTFNYAYGLVTGAIGGLSLSIPFYSVLSPQLKMVKPILEEEPETLSNHRQVNSVDGSLTIDHVSFRYTPTSPLVLDDLSLRVAKGEYVAIVGRTGCGKSTLLRLILGFEKPLSGSICFGRQDISTVDARSLRRALGVVLQDGDLIAGDIFSNIVIAHPKATLEDAWEAAELAGIADDIRAMPQGMHTVLTEGAGGISGGQRQRILIARAVCGKPNILLFDEATSALDNVTQKHVSDALDDLACTRIIIAHRLSTIRNADRIIMLEDGHIVEDGTYEELIALDGRFADLVRRQRLEEE